MLPQPLRTTAARGPAMWQSLAAQRRICEGSMNYLWRALALFAGFINSSGGYISKVPTNTVEKHVLWHLSTPLIGNLGLQECRMHLRSKVSSIIHGKCKNYRTRTSSPSKMVKQDHSCTHIKSLIICSTSVPEICYFNSTLHFEQSAY